MKVDLFREIKFRNSKQTFRGIPIIASNMDTVKMLIVKRKKNAAESCFFLMQVGTFEMATSLAKVI